MSKDTQASEEFKREVRRLLSRSDAPARITIRPGGPNEARITSLSVSPSDRRAGHGTAVMRSIVALADRHDVALSVEVLDPPESTDGLTRSILEDFYARFGFAIFSTDTDVTWMRRERSSEAG